MNSGASFSFYFYVPFNTDRDHADGSQNAWLSAHQFHSKVAGQCSHWVQTDGRGPILTDH